MTIPADLARDGNGLVRRVVVGHVRVGAAERAMLRRSGVVVGPVVPVPPVVAPGTPGSEVVGDTAARGGVDLVLQRVGEVRVVAPAQKPHLLLNELREELVEGSVVGQLNLAAIDVLHHRVGVLPGCGVSAAAGHAMSQAVEPAAATDDQHDSQNALLALVGDAMESRMIHLGQPCVVVHE